MTHIIVCGKEMYICIYRYIYNKQMLLYGPCPSVDMDMASSFVYFLLRISDTNDLMTWPISQRASCITKSIRKVGLHPAKSISNKVLFVLLIDWLPKGTGCGVTLNDSPLSSIGTRLEPSTYYIYNEAANGQYLSLSLIAGQYRNNFHIW